MVVREPGGEPRLEDLELEPPGPSEVLVRILATGVCRSDEHAIHGFLGGNFPYLLGHEATGIIEAVGEGVPAERAGETVTLSWRAACGSCYRCAEGHPAWCRTPLSAGPRARTADGAVLGRVLELGTFATHTVVHAAQAVPTPADLDARAMCLVGCGVATGVGAALHAAPVRHGSSVVVIGCGAVGLSAVQGARLAGARTVIGTDLDQRKLDWALELGADATVLMNDQAIAEVRRLTDGRGADFALDAVGIPASLRAAAAMCDTAGTVVLIGVPSPGTTLDLDLATFFWSRRTLRTTWYGDTVPERDFAGLADHYRRGELQLDRFVSQTLPLERFADAFADMSAGEVIRTVLIPA